MFVCWCTDEQNLDKIITKDFYPDLPKLQAQAEYLDAVERKDTQKIWELQKKFSRKQTAVRTPGVCMCYGLMNLCTCIERTKNDPCGENIDF